MTTELTRRNFELKGRVAWGNMGLNKRLSCKEHDGFSCWILEIKFRNSNSLLKNAFTTLSIAIIKMKNKDNLIWICASGKVQWFDPLKQTVPISD